MSSEQRFFIVCLGDSEQYKSGSLVGVFSNMKTMTENLYEVFDEEIKNSYIIGLRKNIPTNYNSLVTTLTRDGRCIVYKKQDNSVLFKIQTIHLNTINKMFL